jgi:hypothetical protein
VHLRPGPGGAGDRGSEVCRSVCEGSCQELSQHMQGVSAEAGQECGPVGAHIPSHSCSDIPEWQLSS